MSQVDYNVANADGATVRADINAQLDAIVTNNAGGTEPTTMFANMWWYDSATNDLKQRNEANTAWVLAARKDPSTGWTPYRQGVQLGTPSETVQGVAELATQAETDAGTDDARIVTPLKLAAWTGGGFPANTEMLFRTPGSTAPTGWTKQTTHNNKAIRLQTGTLTTGGADAFTTVFGSSKNTAAATAPLPAHSHVERGGGSGGDSLNTVMVAGGQGTSLNDTTDSSTASAGSGGTHAHGLTLDLQYVDFIICKKN